MKGMQDRKQDIKAAWILSAALAGSSLGLLLIETLVRNPTHEVNEWGLIVLFAGLSILVAGLAFRLMTTSRSGWPEQSATVYAGGQPEYQLIGFGAVTAIFGAAVLVAERFVG
jgi:hypothetical protein